MGSTRLLLSFASELALFVVAAGGLALLATAPDRSLLARATGIAGLTALAVSAFLGGADIGGRAEVEVTRAAGGALVAVSALLAARRGPSLAAAGVPIVSALLLVAADGLRAASAGSGADFVRLAGATLLGATLLGVGARTISGRFVVASGALLTVVVVALSIVLSSVITSRLTDEAFDRAAAQSDNQARALLALGVNAQAEAVLLQALAAQVPDGISAGRQSDIDLVIRSGVGFLGPIADYVALVLTDTRNAGVVRAVREIAPRIDGTGLEDRPVSPSFAVALGSSRVVLAALEGAAANDVELVAGQPVVLGSAPLRPVATLPPIAVAVVGFRLDASRLAQLGAATEGSATYFITPEGVVSASTAAPLPDAVAEALLLAGGPARVGAAGSAGGRYVAGLPLRDTAGRPIGVLAVSVPDDVVVGARRSIFRALFATALGGVVAAFLLAALVGRRVTAPLRRVTAAAGRLREGDLGARAGVATTDEVGTLGVAFDEMATALEGQTSALADAAAEETRLRRQVEGVMMSMRDGVLAVGLDGVITAANRAAVVLLATQGTGVNVRSLRGLERVDPAAPSTFATDLNGTPAIVRCSPITGDAGALTGAVVVLRDISEEQALERMKGDFLANISHEIRTPLTPILGYASLLRARNVPVDQRVEFAGEITRAVSKLDRIVGMLVDFAAFEGRTEPAVTQPVDVVELLDDVAGAFASPEHRVIVDANGFLAPIAADEQMLTRALCELVDNAIKYSPDGGTVTLSARTRSKKVRISVTDEGIGFEEGELPVLLQEFRQADATSTRRFGGLGLGLPFARRIVEAHGGTLTATSEPGKGSTFAIDVPRIDEDQSMLRGMVEAVES